MCQKSIALRNPLGVGDLNIEKVDFSSMMNSGGVSMLGFHLFHSDMPCRQAE